MQRQMLAGVIIDNRIKFIFICLFLAFFSIIIRLFYLQIDQWNSLFKLGEQNFLRTEIIPPLRGTIYDCRGTILATNRPIFDLYWQGGGARRLHAGHYQVLEKLSGIVGDSEWLTKHSRLMGMLERAERLGKSLLLRSDLSFEQVCQISEQCVHIPFLLIKNRFERIYPHGTLASHVLGYVNRAEAVGRDGLEKVFHGELAGRHGYRVCVADAAGKRLAEQAREQAQAGENMTITLDHQLQELAESCFQPGQSGALILMDPEDGAIKALVSYPNFDPNTFLAPISQDAWQEMFVTHNPLLNRVTAALYPPASTFKVVTIAAALEEGLITPDTVFECKGSVTLGKRRFYCQKRSGHGSLMTRQALASSCNTQCFEIARLLSIDQLAYYASCFGLGAKTQFLLGEKSGLVPTSGWKAMAKGEPWWRGETLSASIGQSYLSATPLQIARMICSLCTGYLVRPRLMVNEVIERESLPFKESTLTILREAMRLAVLQGTVSRLRHLEDFELYAKTGTAQTCSLKVKKAKREHYEHAWVAGFFRYKGTRPLTLVVLLEHVGHSRPAIYLAERFLQGYKRLQDHAAS